MRSGMPDLWKRRFHLAPVSRDSPSRTFTNSRVRHSASCPRRGGILAPIFVVEGYRKNNGSGGQREYAYTYEDAWTDLLGRGFLGFGELTVKDGRQPLSETDDLYRISTYAQRFPFTGSTLATEARPGTVGGKLLSPVSNEYAQKLADPGMNTPTFVYFKTSTNKQFELNSTANAPTVIAETDNGFADEYGNFANITVETHATGGLRPHRTQTHNDYDNNATIWRLERLSRSEVTHTSGGKTLTRVSGFGYDSSTGMLNRETVELGTELMLNKVYARDAFGNISKETVSGPGISLRETEIAYNTLPLGRYPNIITNAEHHTERQFYDRHHGTIKELIGPNGLSTKWEYDALGRQISEVRADGTATPTSVTRGATALARTRRRQSRITSTRSPPPIPARRASPNSSTRSTARC